MNVKRNSFSTMAATVMGLFLLPAAANAFTIKPLPNLTDTDFEALVASGKYQEEFVVQTRIGNNAIVGQNPLSGDGEIDILDVEPGRIFKGVTSKQFDFTSGQAVDFSLQYTGSEVKYTVGGQLLSTNIFKGPFTDLFLRTRSQANTSSNSILLSDLAVQVGSSITSIGSLLSNSLDTINYLQISGLTGPFTLTGKSTLNFTTADRNNTVRNAQLAYQIKGGSMVQEESVPEPGTVGALLLTGIAAAVSSKRKKVTHQES